ncbi:hypothetical protein F442_04453 [Phytophthora nicotianae P10297]|uniref:HAT C-terminal dimerisation domain-containing protein n=1 Tax=Phytophthora nicotianae P10297 TaxID=1317064 RepID=W2ZS18_PHYNI|nr:hypothetical protein F442_04453 [Phytophthora nicotianae P10297]
MALSNMQVCALLFSKGTDSTFSCNTRAKVYKKGNGYTNLLNHLMREHPDYERILTPETQLERKMRLGSSSWTSRPLVRQNTTLSPISEDTLALYISRIAKVVEQLVSRLLPDSFGLVLDGWSNSGRHCVAIFCMPVPEVPTVGFLSVEDEEDLSAQSLFDLIADTLTRYRKLWETVKFMVGDNCSVNQCIGRREGAIPLVGCASHRFNLAVQDFLKSEAKLNAKIQALMTKLRTIKGRALLRRVSKLAPLLRNDTRWSSTYAMVKRYVCLEPAISQLGTAWFFRGVTKALQKTTLNLSAVHRLFDQVVKKYPAMKARLVANAAIVNYPNLESGLVKLQRGEALTAAEKVACSQFRLRDADKSVEAVEEQRDLIVKEAFKRRKVAKLAAYEDVAFIPPTSNECERFYSSVKLVYTDLRKRMEPEKLEKVMCLLYNKELWDVQVVDDVRRSNAN